MFISYMKMSQIAPIGRSKCSEKYLLYTVIIIIIVQIIIIIQLFQLYIM